MFRLIEQMCYHTQYPSRHIPDRQRITMTNAQSWFMQRQEYLAERVGEPVLLTIRMCFDNWFEVKIQTFTDRWGMAAGRDLEAAVEGAVEMLVEMDDVVADVRHRHRLAQEE